MAASDLMMLSSCRSLHPDKVLNKSSGVLGRSSGLICTYTIVCNTTGQRLAAGTLSGTAVQLSVSSRHAAEPVEFQHQVNKKHCKTHNALDAQLSRRVAERDQQPAVHRKGSRM